MENADYFRCLVLAQVAIVLAIYVHAGIGDLLHFGRIETVATQRLFFGRLMTIAAIIIMLVVIAMAIISRFGEEDLNPYSILGQVALPLLVLGWGFALRHRYTSVNS